MKKVHTEMGDTALMESKQVIAVVSVTVPSELLKMMFNCRALYVNPNGDGSPIFPFGMSNHRSLMELLMARSCESHGCCLIESWNFR